jgi:hypothetical protein
MESPSLERRWVKSKYRQRDVPMGPFGNNQLHCNFLGFLPASSLLHGPGPQDCPSGTLGCGLKGARTSRAPYSELMERPFEEPHICPPQMDQHHCRFQLGLGQHPAQGPSTQGSPGWQPQQLSPHAPTPAPEGADSLLIVEGKLHISSIC